jgi:AbrB family looped-hinge helix DNA binding protein
MKSQTKSGVNMFPKPEFYGSASVGERGQIVLPAKLRKAFGISPGDQLLVMADPHMNSVMLVKAEVLSAMLTNANDMLSSMNKDITKALETKKK